MFYSMLPTVLAAAAVLGQLPPADQTGPRPQNPRVLFITSADCPRCDEELARLRAPGGTLDTLRSQGWKIGPGPENHLQIVDKHAVPQFVEKVDPQSYPYIIGIEGKEAIRSFSTGCTTPLDAWTFGWLAKGVNERPQAEVPEPVRVASTGSYRLRGNHWSIDGDFSPTRERLLAHLRGPIHGPQIKAEYAIESWSYEELRSLHDDLHEIEMGGVQPYYARAQQSYNSVGKSGSFKNLTNAARKTR